VSPHRQSLVSVVIPVRNAERTVGPALVSVLRQTHDALDVVVVDDGSTDGTLERVAELDDPRVRVIGGGARRGISHRLNEGIAAARGPWIARMDGDDLAFPERLEVQLDYLGARPEVTLVGSGTLFFRDDLTTLGIAAPPESHEGLVARLASGIPLPHPTWLARAEWLRRFPYAPAAAGSEDQQLLYRARRHGRYASVPEVLLAYRESRTLRKVLARRLTGVKALAPTLARDGDRLLATWLVVVAGLKAVGDLVHEGTGASIAARPLVPVPPELETRFRRLVEETRLDLAQAGRDAAR
jgi:glycosyltransferase involved in cell wall biosynthesis